MAKSSNEQPDKKKIDEVAKKLKAVCDELKVTEKEVKGYVAVAKKIEKTSG